MKDNLMIYFANLTDTYPVTYKLKMLMRASVLATLAYEDYRQKCEVSITFTDNEGIRAVNREYRNIDKETDVLSFPMFEKSEIEDVKNTEYRESLGDIVISIERVKEQALEYEHSFEREFAYMLVHGFYHLMGEDHIEEDDKKIMREKEENVLSKLQISR